MTYKEQLLDVRWQKKRLDLLSGSSFSCSSPDCYNPNPNATLHIHHKIYIRGLKVWEYEDWAYAVLCDECHARAQKNMNASYVAMAKYPDLVAVCWMLNFLPPQAASDIAERLFLVVSSIVEGNREYGFIDILEPTVEPEETDEISATNT